MSKLRGTRNRITPAALRAAGEARTARAHARAADLAPIISELRAAGVVSLRAIAEELDRRGIPTATGRSEWQAVQVMRVLKRLAAARPRQRRPEVLFR
jgi:hypothetical protein